MKKKTNNKKICANDIQNIYKEKVKSRKKKAKAIRMLRKWKQSKFIQQKYI